MTNDTDSIDVRTLKIGERVRLFGEGDKPFTIARSEPCDLNPGWWHIETVEAGRSTEGWPVSIRYSPEFFVTADIERVL